jgi:hypothetical protein
MFTGLKINAEKEGKIWTRLTNCNIYDVTGEGFKVDIDVASDLEGILYLGTSKFSMLEEFEGTFSVDKYTFVVTGLSVLTNYYFYIKNTAIGKGGRTGIYSKKTKVYTPIHIDIGSPAIDRGSAHGPAYTIILKDNPANETGKITSIEIWANKDISGLIVATFYNVGGNYFSARDSHSIGTVTAGSKKTFEVSLNVEIGDYLGIYWTVGKMEYDYSGYGGFWRVPGDQTSCSNLEFDLLDGDTLSLYGIGEG